jgi:hypothetical protein
VVGVTTAVVANRRLDAFWELGKLEQELLEPHRRHRTVVLHGRVQRGDGSTMVPVVMKLHGARVDVRLERVGGIGQGIERKRTRRRLLRIAAA